MHVNLNERYIGMQGAFAFGVPCSGMRQFQFRFRGIALQPLKITNLMNIPSISPVASTSGGSSCSGTAYKTGSVLRGRTSHADRVDSIRICGVST